MVDYCTPVSQVVVKSFAPQGVKDWAERLNDYLLGVREEKERSKRGSVANDTVSEVSRGSSKLSRHERSLREMSYKERLEMER